MGRGSTGVLPVVHQSLGLFVGKVPALTTGEEDLIVVPPNMLVQLRMTGSDSVTPGTVADARCRGAYSNVDPMYGIILMQFMEPYDGWTGIL